MKRTSFLRDEPSSTLWLRVLQSLCLVFLVPPPTHACPGMIEFRDILQPVSGKRQEIRLFSMNSKNQWLSLPFQVDPKDADGRLEFFRPKDSFMASKIERSDRLSFHPSQFGKEAQRNPPCKGRSVIELITKEPVPKFAYLTTCKLFAPKELRPLLYDQKSLRTALYNYQFQPTNHMLFQNLMLGRSLKSLARDADIMIKADLKKFFTMRFHGDDMEAKLSDYRLGSTGASANIAFFLKILFFKIKLALTTDVSFFADSAQIPMTMYIPEEANSRLNPGSGVLYHWHDPNESSQVEVAMPTLPKSPNLKMLNKQALKFCQGGTCVFRFKLQAFGEVLQMDFELAPSTVKAGFYPLYVDEVKQYNDDMGWKLDKLTNRKGFYFETSGLKPGNHQWKLWMKLGGLSKKTCPAKINFRKWVLDEY